MFKAIMIEHFPEPLMKSPCIVAIMVAGAAALTACSLIPGGSARSSGGRTLMIPLTGAAEGPGLGDPDGSGMAELMIDPVRGRFCYVLTVEGIAPAQLAHIHRSPAGEAGGPIVVQLEAPTDGESEDCMAMEPGLARTLLGNPAGYYVNVHNADHPGGAVRGQLG